MENTITKEKSHELENKYLTQEELALRFRVSQSTVKNWREKGLLEYFQPRRLNEGFVSEGGGGGV
jgi:transcriptional regulator with XRE-family HTH domain